MIPKKSNQWDLNTEKKNYLCGTIGAFIFGLLSILPWIAAFGLVGKISLLLAFLTGKVSYKGYILFKGKKSPLTRWIVLVVVIFCLFAAHFIIFLCYKNNMTISIENINRFFETRKISGERMSSLGLSFCAAILGMLPLLLGYEKNKAS